jgi:hypothetical protein
MVEEPEMTFIVEAPDTSAFDAASGAAVSGAAVTGAAVSGAAVAGAAVAGAAVSAAASELMPKIAAETAVTLRGRAITCNMVSPKFRNGRKRPSAGKFGGHHDQLLGSDDFEGNVLEGDNFERHDFLKKPFRQFS